MTNKLNMSYFQCTYIKQDIIIMNIIVMKYVIIVHVLCTISHKKVCIIFLCKSKVRLNGNKTCTAKYSFCFCVSMCGKLLSYGNLMETLQNKNCKSFLQVSFANVIPCNTTFLKISRVCFWLGHLRTSIYHHRRQQ